jgi:NTE family protein
VTNKKTSVVLAGGVAKGAFESGALKVLSERHIPIAHVVAASSGALNGVVYAAAIRGRENEAASRLASLWLEDGDWAHALDLSARDFVRGRAIATTARLVALMRREVEALVRSPVCHPVCLTLVVTNVNGETRSVECEPTTTFERRQTFCEASFATREGRERIYEFAAASAAFPLLFAPVAIRGIGPCFDGGLTNNSPISAAIAQGAERVILIAPSPAEVSRRGMGCGIGLVSQLADILVGERLSRDLQQTARINDILRAFDQLVGDGTLSAEQIEAVKNVLGWHTEIELISIRPPRELAGTVFTGLGNRALRSAYIGAGYSAARDALDRHGLA